jgi:hypothetical protein
MNDMAGLTIGDDVDWVDIKKDFINSGLSLKSKMTVIQRLSKEYAVGMNTAEAIADRWGREYRDEIRNAREKYTVGDAVKWYFNPKK